MKKDETRFWHLWIVSQLNRYPREVVKKRGEIQKNRKRRKFEKIKKEKSKKIRKENPKKIRKKNPKKKTKKIRKRKIKKEEKEFVSSSPRQNLRLLSLPHSWFSTMRKEG